VDKTQVYSFEENDHITHRVLHVQLVSKIARTICRSLRLNEDLVEAISLGHDIGHTPFGHKGESILNEICIKENLGYFRHSAQGVKILKDVELRNISIQTLDGILAHNGIVQIGRYNPNKTKSDFLQELENVYNIEGYVKEITPMTLEAAVVRISDVIAYVGRDIEDAILVGSVKRTDIPEQITNILGDNNSKIVDTLIKDVIVNSIDKPYIAFSDTVFTALSELKDWNLENIYRSEEANKNYVEVERLMKELFYKYVQVFFKYPEETDIMTKSERSLFRFVKHMERGQDEKKISGENTKKNHQSLLLRSNTKEKESVIKIAIVDYIAGQTDRFFLKECKNFDL